jgi:imidazoleglycerol phosphate synthase glutamine amidotransferase subunit HisH
MNKVGLINYGMGNITSITNALEYCGIPYSLVNYYDERFLKWTPSQGQFFS